MWTAIYSDGTYLEQFDRSNVEHLFSEIDQDRLVNFVVHTKEGRNALVDLKTGLINIDGINFDFGYGNLVYRLIYFRRVRRTLGSNLQEIGEASITEYLGWQATIQGANGLNNIKRLFGIEKDIILFEA